MNERKREGEKERKREGEKERKNTRSSARDFVTVRDSPIHGRGVFARQSIPKGTRVIEYAGIRRPVTELARDVVTGQTSGRYVLHLDEVTVIDGEREGNAARFINHGCAPNCEIIHFPDAPYVYAMTVISDGEELLLDYRLACSDGSPPTEEVARWFPCSCGSSHCRGTMLGS